MVLEFLFAWNFSGLPNNLMYKNRLQEYTQKSSLQLPVYQTFNEGAAHMPRFRSTVWVDGAQYTSQKTFLHRKAAEQDAANLALESILKRVKDEECPLLDAVCQQIVNLTLSNAISSFLSSSFCCWSLGICADFSFYFYFHFRLITFFQRVSSFCDKLCGIPLF